ncbi:alpha-(1,3)-fucosyltransferase C-like [Ixodes scapularis]|uniref:alpha-(1,3)-fucosyltransferase C-like n=1 Tax=Ixodes scapularis TaxID=6945 RepID=UPI001A9D6563|nr:alpha-(1,3)-fucosyltransferase C-like [Ixodes scapularis]
MQKLPHMLRDALTVSLCLITLGAFWYSKSKFQRCTQESVLVNGSNENVYMNRLENVMYNYSLWTPFFDRKGYYGGKDLPRILLWTAIYGKWHSGLTDQRVDELEFAGCPDRCYIANDRRLLHSSDAVVLYGADLDLADMPWRRNRGQKWVYWSLEPPPHSVFRSLTYLNNTFNWTMTYRQDSDVLDSYVLSLTKKAEPTPYSIDALRRLWEGKTTMAVWPVSHCNTFGRREDYVDELQKYIAADVFGKCGKHRCERDTTPRCHMMFAKNYFFLLSFENAVCKDYVTEKLYYTLLYDIIPVVFGGANYSAVAPPGSYIDALSFESPKHLADHLTSVAEDFNLYKSYFSWKGKYDLVPWTGITFCNLCSKLYSEHFRRSTVYEDILYWWNATSHCRVWDRYSNQLLE